LTLSVPAASFFAGVDWAAESHAVCVLDDSGHVKTQFTIMHSAAGFATLIRRLASLGDPADTPVAIERPDGRLVDALLDAGHPIVPVKPNAIKAWREGEVASGAKSDAGDALVIAEYLRLRQHKLRVAAPYSGQARALRTVVRTRGDLVEMRGRGDQPAHRPAGHALAGRQGRLRRRRESDRARLSAPLPHGGLRQAARGKADGCLLR
jgi:transposase